jgi:hypothetical protein
VEVEQGANPVVVGANPVVVGANPVVVGANPVAIFANPVFANPVFANPVAVGANRLAVGRRLMLRRVGHACLGRSKVVGRRLAVPCRHHCTPVRGAGILCPADPGSGHDMAAGSRDPGPAAGA